MYFANVLLLGYPIQFFSYPVIQESIINIASAIPIDGICIGNECQLGIILIGTYAGNNASVVPINFLCSGFVG